MQHVAPGDVSVGVLVLVATGRCLCATRRPSIPAMSKEACQRFNSAQAAREQSLPLVLVCATLRQVHEAVDAL
jgi:hypothetical protein